MTLSRGALLGYSVLALPLAMAALPIYVHVPKYYATTLGAPLAWIGLILFAARLLDAIQDPLLGYLSDRAAGTRWSRFIIVLLGVPLLAVGFVALFQPPVSSATALLWWLAGSLIVVYVGFSAASISYLAIGAELSSDYHERTRITAARAALGILGVMLAATLPEVLTQRSGEAAGVVQFSLMFVPVLLVCTLLTWRLTPRVPVVAQPRRSWRAMFTPFRHREFRWLLAVIIPSGVAGAIPATLILFFVEDVLQTPRLSGVFLVAYFIAGALSMPAWVAVSRRTGKKNAWLLGMVMAVAAFVWAFALGAGDVVAFAIVCVMSGVAYGAELALPPSILADLVDRGESEHKANGAYFGLWQMIEKLNLAAAAGVALPLLAFLGYQPGSSADETLALSATYALLPCAIKLFGAAILWVAPVDARHNRSAELVTEGGM
ncbi:MAG: MFS transporter [Betaproteobacteria bacterium]|nr:MAG: MFS transporter [Betaproteobacteria bacterium]